MAPDLETAVMRKVAWRLVPFLSLGYLINALDRFNVSIAALTMNKAIGLSATAYGLGAGAFFWSHVLFQFPANLILTKLGARRWMAIILALFGGSLLRNRPAEAAWLTADERAWRSTGWMRRRPARQPMDGDCCARS